MAIKDLDVVETLVDCMTDEDYPVPAGSRGAVVSVYGDGEAFCVEFCDKDHPYGGLLADLPASQIKVAIFAPGP